MRKQTLYRFFEGTASHEEERRIKEWMEASAENKRTLVRERSLYDATILLTEPVREGGRRMRPLLRRMVVEAMKAAAVAAVVFGVGHIFWTKGGNPADDATGMQAVSVPAGQRAQVTLPDGTNVWLNSLSTLRYPTSFGREERRVFLDGEAYLEVMKNTGKTFVVATDKGDIEVLGTSFNVDAYSGSDFFETSLIEGKLNVRGKDDPSQMVELTPDTKATLVAGRLQVEKITDYDHFDWKRGLVSFNNLTLEQIMRQFERHYGVIIRMRNPDGAPKETFTGKFRQTDGIDYALRILQRDIGFSFSYDNEEPVIYIE
ncbi:MAG: FecR domain-containing protein [Alistipes sp.]|nr:FecR domain-containing protein [Alistipes sp.]